MYHYDRDSINHSPWVYDLERFYSVYMNKTLYGHTPNENGLLDLDRVIHIFIILMPKDAKLIMIVHHICGTDV